MIEKIKSFIAKTFNLYTQDEMFDALMDKDDAVINVGIDKWTEEDQQNLEVFVHKSDCKMVEKMLRISIQSLNDEILFCENQESIYLLTVRMKELADFLIGFDNVRRELSNPEEDE